MNANNRIALKHTFNRVLEKLMSSCENIFLLHLLAISNSELARKLLKTGCAPSVYLKHCDHHDNSNLIRAITVDNTQLASVSMIAEGSMASALVQA
ncbi:hypothetical protein M514_00320 [Trichuris suis]|uniref:Uncharacterized protein n=1 Tax=Trichuris suis TaxID=68888 RepID=A0A085MN31_9BILA|nr:hypothetical protein M513_00320 [Trichuris suis]KFD68593.1 hypothetical protein M514_00320 [Trichuris suis]